MLLVVLVNCVTLALDVENFAITVLDAFFIGIFTLELLMKRFSFCAPAPTLLPLMSVVSALSSVSHSPDLALTCGGS
jgi:hypothetical protein